MGELSLPPVQNTVVNNYGKYSLTTSKMPKSMFKGGGSPDFRLVGM